MNRQYRAFIGAILEKPALLYQGVRKIVQGVEWEVRGLPEVSYRQLGYSDNKQKQLVRNYWNEEEVGRVRAILTKRKKQSFTSVSLAMRGAKKDTRSQGWCMNSLVISRAKGFESVEVQYRSTELILKFGGDLCFLPWVFDQLGLKPDVIRFRFANAYLSGVYFPYICNFWNPVDFLQTVYLKDRRLFEQGTRFFLRSAYREDQVFPYSPENVAHRYSWRHLKSEMAGIRRYLEKRHKEFGKPLPKLHYAEGEYVPRGQRRDEEEE